MIKWLNYHHLHYFRVIATQGSIAKASKVLNVGQPALSAQLKQLEENIGQELFERKNRSLVLTEAGKVALDYADEIFRKGEEFIQVFNQKSLSNKSVYKIGVVDSAPKQLTCWLTEEAQIADNECVVSLEEGTPKELNERLRSHELDIVLTNNLGFTGKDNIYSKSIGSYQVAAYGSKKFKKLDEDFPASLEGQPFILPTKHSKLRYDIEHSLMQHKIHYSLIAEVQDAAVKKLMAEHGTGIIFLPEFAARALVKEKKLYKIGIMDEVSEQYWLLAGKRTLKNPITDILMNKFEVR